MKIDTDLRLAVRSVVTAARESESWQERNKREQKAIAELLKKRSIAAKLQNAQRQFKRGEEIKRRAGKIFDRYGLSCSLSSIQNEERFIAAGGSLTKLIKFPRVEVVLAQLASASPAEGAKIIKSLGIKWEDSN